MDKKYQIFVSSTYTDLKNERFHVINAITNLGNLAAGMELFCASNDEQFDYIKRVIDDSDYYVLIIGSRYGSINTKTDLSYTEMEFDYAIEKGIPVLAFIKENAVEQAKEHEKSALSKFIKKVQTGRMTKSWSDVPSLQSAIYTTLTTIPKTCPRQGWQRFQDNADRAELLEEINILRKENDNLQKENAELQQILLKTEEKQPVIKNLVNIKDKTNIRYKYTHDYRNYIYGKLEISWIDIFKLIGPHLVAPTSPISFKHILIEKCVEKLGRSNITDIDDEDIQTIKYQLIAYGLIKTHTGQSKGAGPLEYIELTDKGNIELIKSKVITITSD